MMPRIWDALRTVFLVTMATLWIIRYNSIPGVVCSVTVCSVGYLWSRQLQKTKIVQLEEERSAATEVIDSFRRDLRKEEISRYVLVAEVKQAQRLIREQNTELFKLRRDNERLRDELAGAREKNKRIRKEPEK